MAAEFVRPFRKSQAAKNDRNDAQAIRIAMCQPEMRFVTVKSVEQQAMLAWHRMRSGYCEERTALINRSRGLLAEFGVWLGRSAAALLHALPRLAEEQDLPARLRPLLHQAHEQLLVLALPSMLRHEIDTEVRPSTVKTWLTTRRIPPLQPTDHRRRLSPSIE